MFGLSFAHLLLLLVVVLIVFGIGKLPRVMGDFGKGIRSFKAGLNGEDVAADEPRKILPPAADDKDKL